MSTRKKSENSWQVIGKDYHSYYVRNWIWTRALLQWPRVCNLPAVKLGTRQVGTQLDYLAVMKSWEQAYGILSKRVRKNPAIVRKYIERTEAHGKRMNAFTGKVFKSDLTRWPWQRLIRTYERFADLQCTMYSLGVVLPLLDFGPTSFFTQAVQDFVRRSVLPKRQAEYFSVLTGPRQQSYAKQQELSLLQLLSSAQRSAGLCHLIRTGASPSAIRKQYPVFWLRLIRHTRKFAWVYYVFYGPAYAEQDFLTLLRAYLKKGWSGKARLAEEQRAWQTFVQKRKKYLAKLRPDAYTRTIIDLAGEVVYAKAHRKDLQTISYYHVEKLQREIGRRLGLSLEQVRSTPLVDLAKGFRSGRLNVDHINQILKYHVVLPVRGQAKLYAGAAARTVSRRITEERAPKTLNEVHGTCAWPGSVRGRVAIVNEPADMVKMKEGMVLVSFATTPSVVPAMMKARAIVTDEGGLTCHAAIISREFRIPCLVGTKYATSVFKDGDLVKVVANLGIAIKLEG